MGNHPSSQQQSQSHGGSSNSGTSGNGAARQNIRQLLRNTGALGLSKAELDARCKPSGLYPTCNWEDKQVRRLIGDGKLAARLKGEEVRRQETDTECPICFLNYAQVNQTKCCQASLCTECYLQVRPPREKVVCPFCNSANLAVTLQQALSAEAVRERQAEEQRAVEASMRMRETVDKTTEEQAPGFGSSLAQDENVALMRKRSSSMSEASESDLSSMAMTVDERQALEARLREQQQSPLIQRIQQEELERAFRNEQEYMEQNAGRQRQRGTGRSRRHRDWVRLIQAFEEGGGINSMDDLAMLEAAMRMASMDNDATRRGGSEAEAEGGPSPLRRRMLDSRSARRESGSNGGSNFLGGSSIASQLIMRGLTEEEQLAMAIAASLQETAGSAPAENGTENADSSTAENAESSPAESSSHENGSESSVENGVQTSESVANSSVVNDAQTTESIPEPISGSLSPEPVASDSSDPEPNNIPDVNATEEHQTVSDADEGNGTTGEMLTDSASRDDQLNVIATSASAVEEATAVDAVKPAAVTGSVEASEISEALPAPEPAPERIVAQTGLPVSDLLVDGEVATAPCGTSISADVHSENKQDESGESGPDSLITKAEDSIVEDNMPSVQDVPEAEAFTLSECKSAEELKLPDEAVSSVPSDSILPQSSKDKTVETVDSGASCEA